MPDYDVSAVTLASPPTSAPVTDYRPGITVKNLGIHHADVTGYLNVYDRATGLMVATFSLAAADIAPGETRTASASTLWQPTEADVGKHFLFTGYINYPPDQNLANNQLQPVDVLVTAEEPPPPPPVEAHASQHEDGGSDELTVEGLTGKLAEAQEPTDHAARHGAAGEDQLDVTDLTGLLATPQTPATHAATHEVGGSDPVIGVAPGPHVATHEASGDDRLSVDGLLGILSEPQQPTVHDADFHDSTVEAVANKNVANGYAGLDANARTDPANGAFDVIYSGILHATASTGSVASGQTESIDLIVVGVPAFTRYINALAIVALTGDPKLDAEVYIQIGATASPHALAKFSEDNASQTVTVYFELAYNDITNCRIYVKNNSGEGPLSWSRVAFKVNIMA